MANRQSVILIGMPGAGKSTLGILLAKELGLDFLDTDVAIQVREQRSLQDILDADGYLSLRNVEEQVLLATECHQKVIATGGSAVYSEKGMTYLKSCGPVVYLEVPLDELRRRIHNYETRGIARRPEQSFDDLFEERQRLYRQYADVTVDCDKLGPGEVISEVLAAL
ncbi:shikimate kinase [Gammaproteobacteria bacterium 45_16_T64]|nr:shikimate kinase [Gammaproteobacteria bacterium 45_16_T64]